jgi:hypothetical protein
MMEKQICWPACERLLRWTTTRPASPAALEFYSRTTCLKGMELWQKDGGCHGGTQKISCGGDPADSVFCIEFAVQYGMGGWTRVLDTCTRTRMLPSLAIPSGYPAMALYGSVATLPFPADEEHGLSWLFAPKSFAKGCHSRRARSKET